MRSQAASARDIVALERIGLTKKRREAYLGAAGRFPADKRRASTWKSTYHPTVSQQLSSIGLDSRTQASWPTMTLVISSTSRS